MFPIHGGKDAFPYFQFATNAFRPGWVEHAGRFVDPAFSFATTWLYFVSIPATKAWFSR
jgi:hypothetical protein